MSRRTAFVTPVLVAALLVGCAGPGSPDPAAERPYLVAVDLVGAEPRDQIVGELVVERDCVLLDTDEGRLLPLFPTGTRYGPRDGTALTVDVGGARLRVGDEVRLVGETGPVTEGLRSTYPGVDLTRCGLRNYALVARVDD